MILVTRSIKCNLFNPCFHSLLSNSFTNCNCCIFVACILKCFFKQAVTDHKAALANDHEEGGLDDTDTDTDSEFDNNDVDDGRAADAYARGK